MGQNYQAWPVDQGLRLYAINDDRGQRMLVSLFGRTLTNGGFWHLQHDGPAIAEHSS